MLTLLNVLLFCGVLPRLDSQECISSPPELELSPDIDNEGNTIYRGTLRFDAKRFTTTDHGYPTSFTTRVFNGILPSPTIRFRRDETYYIKVFNDLEAEDPADNGAINTFHYANTTNIHTHGLHISPEPPGDDAFLSIKPGESHEYIFYIGCNHHGGTSFWHPHHHGATAVQVGGGAAGALIIEDDAEKEGLPDWLVSMDEVVLLIQYLDLRRWIGLTSPFDKLTQRDQGARFYLINGKYEPIICLKAGESKRLRIAYSDIRFKTEIKFAESSQCIIYLLAKDGVYLSNGPRLLITNILYFTHASRVDVIIRCSEEGEFRISAWDHDNNNNPHDVDGVTIGNLMVTDDGEIEEMDITQFEPIRPRYLISLMDVDESEIDNFWTVTFQRNLINGLVFNGPDAFQMEIGCNEKNEWNVVNLGALKHPLHIHVNHFQLIETEFAGTDPAFTLKGDWVDTVSDDAKFRFWSDTFGGTMILHCHILEHEDEGKMAVYRVRNGCDGEDIECIRENTECNNNEIEGVIGIHNNDNNDNDYTSKILAFIVVAIFCVFILCMMLRRRRNKNKEMMIQHRYGSIEMAEIDKF